MKKLILAVVRLVILACVAIWLVFRAASSPPTSPLVTLPDGTSLRIIGVTYGTNHVIGSALGRGVARLPDALQDILPSLPRLSQMQSLTTTNPVLVIWLDHQTNHASATTTGFDYSVAQLGDSSNFVSGSQPSLNSFLPWSQVENIQFSAFPRRNPIIYFNVYHRDSNNVMRFYTNLTFVNPVNQTYPQWPAEPLPVTKRVGDLEVTLRDLETGHDNDSSATPRRGGGMSVTYGTNRIDGRNITLVDLKFHPLIHADEVWQVTHVTVSDATGNSLDNSSLMTWGNSQFGFDPGLWPGEAWNLKPELKQTQGFRPEEIFTFNNVPLGELDRTNVIGWTTNMAGVTVTLQSIYRHAPIQGNAWSSTQFSVVHLTLSSARRHGYNW